MQPRVLARAGVPTGGVRGKGSGMRPQLATATAPRVQMVGGKVAGVKGQPPAKGKGKGKETGPAPSLAPMLTVTTKADSDEIGIATLLGDYAEKGTNHGRKYFVKLQKIEGHEDVKVFLYFWDQRDGAEFSGWWFGDQLGGSQVWARCPSTAQAPPRVGWRIPWDADHAEPGLLFVDQAKGSTSGISVKAEAMRGGGTAAQWESKSEAYLEQIQEAENAAKAVVSNARTVDASAGMDIVLETEEELNQISSTLDSLSKSLVQDAQLARGAMGLPAHSKFAARVKAAHGSCQADLNRLRQLTVKVKAQAEATRKQAEDKQKNSAKEEADGTTFQEELPDVVDNVSAAEDAVEGVAIIASPLTEDPPEGETAEYALKEVEECAVDAQNKIAAARKLVTGGLSRARQFAPETRKVAVDEYTKLQNKLTEAQTKLNPFKKFRAEFQQRLKARTIVADLDEKLGDAELELEKAGMMVIGADKSQMPVEEVKLVEELLQQAQRKLNSIALEINNKLKTADSVLKEELAAPNKRTIDGKKRLQEMAESLKSQRVGIQAQTTLTECNERVDKAAEAFAACGEAELPFLKGIEVLPDEESTKAIADCEASAKKADVSVKQAKAFLQQKQAQFKQSFTKELQAKFDGDFKEVMQRLDELGKQISTFKTETMNRRLQALMADVLDAVTEAEEKTEKYESAGAPFTEEGDADLGSSEALKSCSETASAAEKAAEASIAAARKIVLQKQQQNKGKPDIIHGIQGLQNRLTASSKKLTESKKTILAGEKQAKAKIVRSEEEKKVKSLEEQIEQTEARASTNKDSLSTADIEEITKSVADLQSNAKKSQFSVQSSMSAVGPDDKAKMQELVVKIKKIQQRVEAVKVATKAQRERVRCETHIKDATDKVDGLEELCEKISTAELPFIKGLEVSLREATGAISESESLCEALQKAVSELRNSIASWNLEIKQFGDKELAKKASESFAKLSERISSVSAKQAIFKKETEDRKRVATLQGVGEQIDELEVELKAVKEATAPFETAEAADANAEAEEEDKSEACMKLSELQKSANAKLDAARTAVALQSKDAAMKRTHGEQIGQLQTRIMDANVSLTKFKKIAQAQLSKYRAKSILTEGQAEAKAAEEVLEKASKDVAPLLEEKCEPFLVANALAKLGDAILESMESKSLSIDEFFATVCGGKEVISTEEFAEWLEKLPETLGKENLGFAPGKRGAQIFKSLAGQESGLSFANFKNVFQKRYVCVSAVSVTSGLSISDSQTEGKLEVGEDLQSLGPPTKDVGSEMMRVECTSCKRDLRGFVSLTGNAGSNKFLSAQTAFGAFTKNLNNQFEEHKKQVSQKVTAISALMTEASQATAGSALAKVKADLTKLKVQAGNVTVGIENLKKKALQSRSEYTKLVEREKNAHLEAKEQKQADVVVAGVNPKFAALEAMETQLREASEKLTKLEEAEQKNFSDPASVSEEVRSLNEKAKSAASELREDIKQQQQLEQVKTATKGPLLDAKKDLAKMLAKVTQLVTKCEHAMGACAQVCNDITQAVLDSAGQLLRAEAVTRTISAEALFTELAGGGTTLTEEVFTQKLQKLEGLGATPAHVKLCFSMLRVPGRDSVDKRTFLAFVQQHFVVIKAIALTTELDINECKTLRRVEPDEIIETIEGPKPDAKTGMSRIRGRALQDGQEGWISVKGNQGTAFLKEISKPVYVALNDMPMEKEFSGAQEAIRTLHSDEVVELLEGPRKDQREDAQRVKCKASKDGVSGWFTLKSGTGEAKAVKSEKFYTCTSSVAMTDVQNIRDCKVVRKLNVGELFLSTGEGPIKDEEAKVTRLQGKAMKDNLEGWITIKGNAGTEFAKPDGKNYEILEEVILNKTFKSDAEIVRRLEKGEAVELIDGPRTEHFESVLRIRGKVMSGDEEGWMTLGAKMMSPWHPTYQVVKAQPMREGTSEDSTEVASVKALDWVDFLDGPVLVGKTLKIKARSEAGPIGWLALRNEEGEELAKNAPRS